jgi:hypothetical protein
MQLPSHLRIIRLVDSLLTATPSSLDGVLIVISASFIPFETGDIVFFFSLVSLILLRRIYLLLAP